MNTLKDFINYDIFDFINDLHDKKYIVRQDLKMLINGSYDDIIKFMENTKYKNNEIYSVKIRYPFKIIEITII